jgi:hypothetical protein
MSSRRPGLARRATGLGSLLGCSPRGCLLLLVLAIVGLAVVGGLGWGVRAALHPWSVPLGGRPTLTGDWAGTLRTASGAYYGLSLRIAYDERTRTTRPGRRPGTSNRSLIEGSGELCNRRGERYSYTLHGSPYDRDGLTSWLNLGSVDTSVTGSAWFFEGRWEGDRLLLTGANSFELDERPVGGRPHLLTLDPLVGTLQRAPLSALESVCQRLAAEAR